MPYSASARCLQSSIALPRPHMVLAPFWAPSRIPPHFFTSALGIIMPSITSPKPSFPSFPSLPLLPNVFIFQSFLLSLSPSFWSPTSPVLPPPLFSLPPHFHFPTLYPTNVPHLFTMVIIIFMFPSVGLQIAILAVVPTLLPIYFLHLLVSLFSLVFYWQNSIPDHSHVLFPIIPVIVAAPPGRRGRSLQGGGAPRLGSIGTWVSRFVFFPCQTLLYVSNYDAILL